MLPQNSHHLLDANLKLNFDEVAPSQKDSEDLRR